MIWRVHQGIANSFRSLFKLLKEKYTNLLEAVQQKNDHATEILRKEMAPWWHSCPPVSTILTRVKLPWIAMKRKFDPSSFGVVRTLFSRKYSHVSTMEGPRALGTAMLEKLHYKIWKFSRVASDKHFTVGSRQSLFGQLLCKFFWARLPNVSQGRKTCDSFGRCGPQVAWYPVSSGWFTSHEIKILQ